MLITNIQNEHLDDDVDIIFLETSVNDLMCVTSLP